MPRQRESVPAISDCPEWSGFRIRDGEVELSAGEINSEACELRKKLKAFRTRRVAVLRPRAALVAIILTAIKDDAFGIALLRSPESKESMRSLQIAGVMDENGDIHETGTNNKGTKDPEILLQTSGTTGPPKVVAHSMRALLGGIKVRPATSPPARWLLTYPVAAFAGLQVLLTALSSGDELIVSANPSAASLTAAAMAHRPTHMSATPTFWRSFVASCGSRAGLIPLRQITLGGEIADQRTLELLRQAFPEASLTHIYASTEAGNVFSVKDGRAGFPASWLNTGIDDVQLRISDGVLQVKSPRAMIAKTAEECESVEANGGWIQTGDLVEIRGDRVMFLGRKDTLINVGGFKVIPEEVERIILEVPGIVQARVYGCPNPVTGNVVGTEIVLSGVDQSEILPKLQATLASKLDRYKCPRIIKFIEQIPESDTGKVSRTL